jgi:N-acetyl-gamma-glutamyl-phosphate reductase
MKIKVGIIGGTGYTGVELLRILATHPAASVEVITSRGEAGTPVSEIFPSLRGHLEIPFVAPDEAALESCDVVFSAAPNGVAMSHARRLLEAGARLIDVAADFRLEDPKVWEQWYGMPHECPDLLDQAVYGLPELNREAIRDARIVANPGCYPTTITLALLPLLAEGLIAPGDLIADAKSGVSGAGRKASVGTLLAEASESMKAYAVAGHRHQPEIQQTLSRAAREQVALTFVPHLTPMIRGIHATVYATLKGDAADVQQLFERYYAAEPFVDVMPPGSHPETRSVRGCNTCRVAVHRPVAGRRIVVLSVIDNLVKGAAGQAVQNMNIMTGLDETLGLEAPALLP